MTLDPSTLSWTCMVCGDSRPDAVIGVEQHPVWNRGEVIPGAVYNLRHCTDRPGCVTAAKTHGPLRIGEPRADHRFMPVYEVHDPRD